MLTDLYKRFLAGEEVSIYPQRGTNAIPVAFNPNTGLVYIQLRGTCRASRRSRRRRNRSIGANSTGVIGRDPAFKPGDVVGHFVAIDPLTGDKKWEIPLIDMPSSAGMLVTGGGLVFTGKLTGEFVALDEDTGADALAVQDRLEHQRHGDHLHPQGAAVRDGSLRDWAAASPGVSPRAPSRRAARCGRLR